jgi:hypothetical protein
MDSIFYPTVPDVEDILQLMGYLEGSLCDKVEVTYGHLSEG